MVAKIVGFSNYFKLVGKKVVRNTHIFSSVCTMSSSNLDHTSFASLHPKIACQLSSISSSQQGHSPEAVICLWWRRAFVGNVWLHHWHPKNFALGIHRAPQIFAQNPSTSLRS